MPLDDLSVYLYLQVGQLLDLTLEDYEAALEWLRDDPVGCSILMRSDAAKTRGEAQEIRARAQDLCAAGLTRRLLSRPAAPPDD